LHAAAAERKTIDIGGVEFTPAVAPPAPLREPDEARRPAAAAPERRPRGFTLAQRRQLREAKRVERREQRRLGGFIVCSDDSEEDDDASIDAAPASTGGEDRDAETTPKQQPITLASFFTKTPASSAAAVAAAPAQPATSSDDSASDAEDGGDFQYRRGSKIWMRFANDSPRAREEEFAGVVEEVDPVTGLMRLHFAEDGQTLHDVGQDDPDLRLRLRDRPSLRKAAAAAAEEADSSSHSPSSSSCSDGSSDSDSESSSSSDSDSDSESDSEEDKSQPQQLPERRDPRESPAARAERLSHILANSPALVKRKQEEQRAHDSKHKRRARIANAVVKQAVEGGLRRVPDELRKLQALNYGAVSASQQQQQQYSDSDSEAEEDEDEDLNIDMEVGQFDLTDTSTRTSTAAEEGGASSTDAEEPLIQMRVVKRAKLRISSARDSETCGHLNVDAVVNVLERVVLGDDSGSAAAGGPSQLERVRCSEGWLSVTSASGNRLLEPVNVNPQQQQQEDKQQQQEEEEAREGADDVESWSDLWPSTSHHQQQQQQKEQQQGAEEQIADIADAVEVDSNDSAADDDDDEESEEEDSEEEDEQEQDGRRVSRRLASKRRFQPPLDEAGSSAANAAPVFPKVFSARSLRASRAKRRRIAKKDTGAA
jgi:hypothetical protein